MNTEQSEIARLSNFLWHGFEHLPAHVEPETCKKYLLTLFFLKAVTAIGQDQVDAVVVTPPAPPNAGLSNSTRKAVRLVVPPDAQFNLVLAQRNEEGNVERVAKALRSLGEANREKLGTLFDELDFQSTHTDSLDACDLMLGFLLAHVGQPEFDLRPSRLHSSQVLGGVFSELLYRFGEFHRESCAVFTTPSPPEERLITPRPIAQLMARLVKPMPGDVIFDPACGTAGLLVTCGEQLRHTHQSNLCLLLGQEINGERCALSRMHLVLSGFELHRLKCGDSISDSLLHDLGGDQAQFDVVVTVPPALITEPNAHVGSHARFRPDSTPHNKCPGLTFAMHMRACLRPKTGRMAVLLPIEALSRGGMERDIREQLVNANAIDSVICLPLNIIPGYPHQATALLLLRPEAAYAPIHFVDARQVMGDDPDAIFSSIADAVLLKREIEGLSRFISWSEIAHAGFDLAAQFLPITHEEHAA